MVEIKDIVDRESLEGWLRGQPQEVPVWIARRAAMRLLPIYWDWTVTSENARERGLIALPFLRFNLISEVARKMPTFEVSAAAASYAVSRVAIAAAEPAAIEAAAAASAIVAAAEAAATHAAAKASTSAAALAAVAAASAAVSDEAVAVGRAAVAVGEVAAESAAHAAAAVAAAARAATAAHAAITDSAAVWEAIRVDCEATSSRADLDKSLLWADQENPIGDVWANLKSKLPVASPSRSLETARRAAPLDWSFWIKWYDDALAGVPPNWKMLEEIALIEPAEWEKGAIHINNEVIAGIVEKYRLLREVQDLRKELGPVRQAATAAAMGHNNPPEGIDTDAEAVVVAQTEIIWIALGEAEEELSKPEPSPSVLKRAGTAILGAIKSVLAYAGKLVDVGLKATAVTVGGGIGAYLISKGPEIQSFAEQVIEFAAKYLH